ncbi:hypothetical protein [Afipia clevelandensis]|uniref:hypothetical protein n=1 Tax=Afipia clevelandensis TaxID=1034 RepID=UPI001FDA8A36|nr:hypothetical protein [Afipia clevelandensis]
MQIATRDAKSVAETWRRRLGAEEISFDVIKALRARRTTLRVGTGEVELLEPDGTGIVEHELVRRGRSHVFGAGATSLDMPGLASNAINGGAQHIKEGDQDFIRIEIEGSPVHFVISPLRDVKPAGKLDFLYEVTLLVADQSAAVNQISRVFGLNRENFVAITSELFGYSGVLTLFSPDRLDRFEVITPTDASKTMGRYCAREGVSFYMAYAESRDVGGIERSARADGAGLTLDSREKREEGREPEQIWLHPSALDGMMLGISRPTLAWKWSGHPERVLASG